MLLGVDFCLAVGEFVASFVDLLQRSLICPHFQQIVLGIGRVDLGLQVFGLLLAVAGIAATELGTQGAAQRVQVSGLGWQGEQAEQTEAQPSRGLLASTGANVWMLVLVGIVLLGIGGALAFRGRRES